MFKTHLYFIIVVNVIYSINCNMEPFIVGGSKARIDQFPHSVFILICCVDAKGKALLPSVCGGSILNEKLVLTAAHCVEDCKRGSEIIAFVGHVQMYKGSASRAHSLLLHEHYNTHTMYADIALIRLKTRLKFNKNAKRIVLMKEPPYTAEAQIAGWGLIDEFKEKHTKFLWYIKQKVWRTKNCMSVIRKLPKGTICASNGNDGVYSSGGDSGNALVVRGYIQIGLVSFKMPSISRSIVIYTDTGYYYNWIRKNSKRLYCPAS